MPQLTAQETELLKVLDNPSVKVVGKSRMREATMLIYRLMHLVDESTREHETAKTQLAQANFERSAIAVAAFGFKSRESIVLKEGMNEGLRARCVQLRENYDYARLYREQNGLDPLIDYQSPVQQDEAAQ